MKHLPLILALLLGTSSVLSAFSLRSNAFPPDDAQVYKTIEGEAFELFIFYPDGSVPAEPRPGILLFHGGGFSSGAPTQFYYLSRYLASRGMVAISVQYRTENDGVLAVRDGKSAMRYVRANAASLGIDPAMIAAGGGSAGGALAAAISTSSIINDADDDLSVSEKPQALVLFNPIYYASAFSKYSQAIQDDFTPYDNISAEIAPALVMFGELDSFVDPAQMLQFQQAMLDVGVRSELFIYENRGHAWFDNDREAVFETLKETDIFLESEGFLDGPPTIEAWLADYNNDVGTQYPTVTPTAPADGATFSEWTNLAVTADASDPDAGSSINNVRIYLNGSQLRVDGSAPYAWGPGSGETDPALLNLAAGEYTIDFEARDDDGMWAKDRVTITVVEAPLEPPAPPIDLISLPADSAASLDWSDNLEGDVVGYKLYRRTAGGTFGDPILTGIENSTVTDTQVAVGDSFFYAVSAVDADGNESARSSEVEVTIISAQTANVPASSNAFVWKRNNDNIYNAKEELGLNRGDWNGFAQAAFIRFDLSGSGAIGGIDADDLTTAVLELYATATDGGDTIRVFGLLDGAGAGVAGTLSETTWTGGSDGTAAGGNNLHESNRPDGPNPAVPPNALTTVELGNLTFAPAENANVGLLRLEITELAAFQDFLQADTNQEITLILCASQKGDVTQIASLYNTSGLAVPTLSVVGSGGTPPPAPADLSATPGDAQVSLTWTADPVTDPVTYSVYRSETPGGSGTEIATGLTASSYVDSSAVNGTIYYYRVTARNADGDESDFSAEVFAIPAAPGNQAPSFEFATINAPGVDVGAVYTASIADAAADPEADSLFFAKVSGPDWLLVAPDGGLSGTAPLVTGPNSFTVRVDAAGGSDTATLEILVVPDDTPPPVPGGLSASAGDGTVALTWEAAGDADTASYELYRSEVSGDFGSPIETGLTGTSFTDSTAVNGTTYYYALIAVDASGNASVFSDEVSATPEEVLDIIAPNAPTGLVANPGDGTVTLDWADSPEADWDSYRVYRSTTSGDYNDFLAADLTESSFTDSGLSNGTPYYYVVTAVDTSGNVSVASAEVSAIPSEATAVVVADYTFTGQSMTSSDSDPDSSASDIAEGGGLNVAFETRGIVADQPALKWIIGDFNNGVILDDDYLAFTVTPEPATGLAFDSLSCEFNFTANAGAQLYLFSSIDGFTTGAAIDTYTNEIQGTNTVTIDLSALPVSGSPVEFRIFFDTSATFASGEARIDNIQLRATSVPVISGPDADGDGIDDAWEAQYFPGTASIDGSADSDGDGVLDFFEYLYGSVPTDAASGGFRLEAEPNSAGGAPRFVWSVEADFALGADYAAEVSSDLIGWDPLPETHYSLETSSVEGRARLSLELTHDYGEALFMRLVKP